MDGAVDAGWAALEAAFGALGRVLLLLDGELRVVRATATLDAWVCPDACHKIVGHSVEELLGPRLFGTDEGLRAALESGEREEGRRAFVQCHDGAARLASLTAAPVPREAPWGAGARYLLVLRPAEDDELALEGALAAQGLVARAPAMLRIVRFVESLHRSEATVLITGESGTGKELVARAIHAHSPRRGGPFVAVNCGALPAELLESELFGHVRGAFTGAVRDRVGRFDAARGGVLFLDEIGDLPLPLQVKLLRALQARTYERVGESDPRTLDARVIAATNVDLKEAIAAGRFREDLYYRLRVVPIHVPPLRERPEDVEPLARWLLSRIAAREGRAVRLSADVLAALRTYAWPGNVRELENALEYAVAVCQRQTVQLEDLPPELAEALGAGAPMPVARTSTAGGARGSAAAEAHAAHAAHTHDDADARAATHADARAATHAVATHAVDAHDAAPADGEAAALEAVLAANHWHHARAAAQLGISRTTLWRRMRALGLSSTRP